ncbi:unnamed protein product [Ilex paraguariensis]|uniref:Uncharacterized protein n=1 Tax=Ilex paraguariensis TaxID=185542 RepID=A0ABC8SIF4_9AQUA
MVQVMQEVSRMLLGMNCGRPLEIISLPDPAKALSSKYDFDLQVAIGGVDSDHKRWKIREKRNGKGKRSYIYIGEGRL